MFLRTYCKKNLRIVVFSDTPNEVIVESIVPHLEFIDVARLNYLFNI